MSDKIYVGSGKAMEGQYGKFMKLSFNKGDLKKLQDNLSDRGWVNLNLNQRKEPSEHGSTHYMTVDTWQPNDSPQKEVVSGKPVAQVPPTDDFEDDIPF